jgi:hypothetical protein
MNPLDYPVTARRSLALALRAIRNPQSAIRNRVGTLPALEETIA